MTAPRGMFDFLRSRGERFVNEVTAALMQNPQFLRAVQGAWKGKAVVDEAVARAIKAMNVPTRTEFKRALARIEALEHELAEQKRRSVAPAAPRPAAARRAGAGRKGSAKGSAARRKTSARPADGAAGGSLD